MTATNLIQIIISSYGNTNNKHSDTEFRITEKPNPNDKLNIIIWTYTELKYVRWEQKRRSVVEFSITSCQIVLLIITIFQLITCIIDH